MAFEVVNPATGEALRRFEEIDAKSLRRAIGATHESFLAWRTTSFAERARLMREAARVLRARAKEYAVLMAEEMGKPVRDGRGEAEKCAWVCEYYAEHAERFLAPEEIATDARRSFVSFQPLGLVLAVMPWNFPFWQVFRCAAPALMAGNGVLLKHAANVPGCALAIEEIFREAGFPESLFRTLMIGNKRVSAVIRHPAVCAVSLTGSTGAGRAVARAAGSALKKCVLELGGSDPYLLLDDCDLPAAVEACATSRLVNAGQSCIAAKRFIVAESLRAEFEQRLVERMGAVETGDPLDERTVLGPQARRDLRDSLHEQVQASVRLGARCLLGGKVPAGAGAFYPPTVLTDVRKGMPAYDEELFGPVAAIIAASSEREAVQIANDSPFGLGAAVFTRDLARGEAIAEREIAAGACFVNAFVRSDPRLPFGGIKESGFGRELSHYGIREFVNVKAVYSA